MSAGIQKSFGPYLYAEGALTNKKFGDRSFTIIISGARNAGIIGPEDNGIVILDDDNRSVVLDNHIKETSGYDGPSKAQVAERDRIMGMDWKAFTDFMANHPRYRDGSVPDINREKPDAPETPEDREIFPLSERNEDNPYKMPLTSRNAIIDFLDSHPTHSERSGERYLSWNIKVGTFDTTGHVEGYTPNKEFDELWNAEVENNPDLFNWACEDGLRIYLNNEYTLWDDEKPVPVEMFTAGRSGGHLILGKIDGAKLELGRGLTTLEVLRDLSDDQLVMLYKIVTQLDDELTPQRIANEMAWSYAHYRQIKESDWEEENTPKVGRPL